MGPAGSTATAPGPRAARWTRRRSRSQKSCSPELTSQSRRHGPRRTRRRHHHPQTRRRRRAPRRSCRHPLSRRRPPKPRTPHRRPPPTRTGYRSSSFQAPPRRTHLTPQAAGRRRPRPRHPTPRLHTPRGQGCRSISTWRRSPSRWPASCLWPRGAGGQPTFGDGLTRRGGRWRCSCRRTRSGRRPPRRTRTATRRRGA